MPKIPLPPHIVMSPRQLVKIVLLGLVLCYALARTILMVNEYFDRSPPQFVSAKIISKTTHWIPMPVAVLKLEMPAGNVRSIEVLEELYDKVKIGDALKIVRCPGFLGAPWIQDKDFYNELAGTRIVQGWIYAVLLCLLLVGWYWYVQKTLVSRKAALIAVAAVSSIAYGIFFVMT